MRMNRGKAKSSVGSRPRLLGRSRITSKGQATIPAPVRKRLELKSGDTVLFSESERGVVAIRRAEPLDLEFLDTLGATLSEWNSENDDRAFRDL